VKSNTISEEVYEKEIQSKLTNIKDINEAVDVFKQEDVIAIDKNETNFFLIRNVMAQTTPKQKTASEKFKKELNLSIQNIIQENGVITRFVNNIVKFKEESIEFTMVALNECFKQN
jgi:Tfp pilus assembly protein PilF